MLHSRPLSISETDELYSISIKDANKRKFRLLLYTAIVGVLTLIYPASIIVSWYIAVMITEVLGFQTQIHLKQKAKKNLPINSHSRICYFIVSWLESSCFAALFSILFIYETQSIHYVPYIILLCSTFFVAIHYYQNTLLMFGHLAVYNLALVFVAGYAIWAAYPEIDNAAWAEFGISLLIFFLLTNSYLFLNNINRERIEKTAQLDAALAHSEKLAQEKSDLIAALGHELRTPLTGILGFSQILKRTKLSKEQIGYVEHVEKSGSDLQRLLSNILDGETLEQGLLRLHPVATDINEVLSRKLETFKTAAAQKGIHLKLEIADGFPDEIVIDEIRLGQCVANLLSNAVRHTDTGGVTLRAEFIKNKKTNLRIAVHDTGSGIPIDQTETIFEKFSRVENNTKTGTGLGLWLVQSIAQAMNGSLSLAETSTSGSTFMLEFDIATQDVTPPNTVTKLDGKRILHIEDTETNLVLLRFLMEEQGVILSEAETGGKALRMLQTAEYDAVLCDLQLPDYDGNDLPGKIRTLDRNADIPIIALTAQPEAAKNQPHSTGFQAILSKPIDHQLLVSTLKQLLSKSG